MMAFAKSLGKLASLMTNVDFPQQGDAAVICQRGTRCYRTPESLAFIYPIWASCIPMELEQLRVSLPSRSFWFQVSNDKMPSAVKGG